MNLLTPSVELTGGKPSLTSRSNSESALVVDVPAGDTALSFQQARALVASGVQLQQSELKLTAAKLDLDAGLKQVNLLETQTLELKQSNIESLVPIAETIPTVELNLALEEGETPGVQTFDETINVELLVPTSQEMAPLEIDNDSKVNVLAEAELALIPMPEKVTQVSAEKIIVSDEIALTAGVEEVPLTEELTQISGVDLKQPSAAPVQTLTSNEKNTPQAPQPIISAKPENAPTVAAQAIAGQEPTYSSSVNETSEKNIKGASLDESKNPASLSLEKPLSKDSRAEPGLNLSDASFEEILAVQSESETKAHNLGRDPASTSASPVSNTGRVQIPISIHVSKPEWANMVAERTALLFSQNISSAELQLDPPELGPLQVKVTVNQDQASVVFTAASPMVRDTVDQGIARLRELLSQQGLDLVNVDVSDQQQSFSNQQDGENNHNSSQAYLEEEPQVETEVQQVQLSYGIDSYA